MIFKSLLAAVLFFQRKFYRNNSAFLLLEENISCLQNLQNSSMSQSFPIQLENHSFNGCLECFIDVCPKEVLKWKKNNTACHEVVEQLKNVNWYNHFRKLFNSA